MSNTLSVAVSRMQQAATRSMEVAGLDAGFDGGEFSGEGHERMVSGEVQVILDAADMTGEEFIAAVTARTSDGWTQRWMQQHHLFSALQEIDHSPRKSALPRRCPGTRRRRGPADRQIGQ